MARPYHIESGYRHSSPCHSSSRSRKKSAASTPRQVVEKYKLDFVSRVAIRVFLGIYLPGIGLLVFLVYRSVSVRPATILIFGGYLSWTLFEYWVHRLVLHWELRQRFLARLYWMGHGHHHTYPDDPLRLVFPLIFSVPILLGTAGIFVLAIGAPSAYGFSAGWIFGYVLMDTIHYLIHRRRPANRVGRWLHELHMRHHFEEGSHGFGIASPWWDSLFGTTYDRAIARSRRAAILR
jgi:sterol desaturase/sphingolipid hydroxylase (fatty acid hydroxylase superfamily)